MKAFWLLGLLALLLTVAYEKVGTAGNAAQRPVGPVALQGAVAIEDKGLLPVRLSDYLLLHRTLQDDLLPSAMTWAATCPE